MIILKHRGNFSKTEKFLTSAAKAEYLSILRKYGQEGVNALASATPVDSGLTAMSWDYNIRIKGNRYTLEWTNSNVVNGVPIAIILQYGHATRTGGYVQGRDYINPAIRPVFDKIADQIWKEVNR